MSEILLSFIFYFGTFVIVISIIFLYLKLISKKSKTTLLKIEKAKESGLHEPVSLHPVINSDSCIGSGACIEACPEKDILGWVNGKSATINTSRCVGHGACFHACPTQAISLCIGTEKRGVELPHVSQQFETNIPMLFIAGELGGMGLIRNAVEQGRQAVENITKKISCSSNNYDLIIVGAGPAGISASLTAMKNSLKFITFEQDSIGGTVFNFPRQKIIMTQSMELSLYGKVKLSETNKIALLNLWNNVLNKNEIKINENEKVVNIKKNEKNFEVETTNANYNSTSVLLAIGRRGSPRKLGVKGEEKEKVAYRLIEAELIHNQNILIVGGGDSAIESALLLMEENNFVTITYRSETFSRLKPKNLERINLAIEQKNIEVFFNSNVKEILDKKVLLIIDNKEIEIKNDLVYIFAGGELPTHFLEKIGIKIKTKFGEAILEH